MKKELKEIFTEILNLGMVLRQDQLRGYSQESGNDVLENYLDDNEERIAKILENPFENIYEIGERIGFTKECQTIYDLVDYATGIVNQICDDYVNVRVSNGEERFNEFLPINYLVKL